MAVPRASWWLGSLAGADRTVMRRRRGGLIAATVIAAPVVFAGIAVPTPWQDEAASMLVMERSWSQLLLLLSGQDVPLVPYYVLVKALVSILPGVPTLLLLRSVSALAALVTVGALYSLVVRRIGLLPGLLSVGILLALPGFSRYAQEARPYALLTALTVLSWLAWDTWRRPGSLRRAGSGGGTAGSVRGGLGYAAALAGAGLFQSFGLFHWPAQLAADLTTPGLRPAGRVRRAAATATAMAVALLIIGVQIAQNLVHGVGSNHVGAVGLSHFVGIWVRVISGRPQLVFALPVVLLAGFALLNAAVSARFGARYRDLVRVAALWLIIPLMLSVAAAYDKHQLLRVRYWTPSLPPLALLAAIGTIVAAEMVVAVLRRDSSRRSVGVGYRRARAVSAVVIAVSLFALAAVGVGGQLRVRRGGGHGVSLGPAITALDVVLKEHPDAELAVTPKGASAIVLASHPELRSREILDWVNHDRDRPWPSTASSGQVRGRLASTDTLVWLRLTRSPTDGTKTISGALRTEGFTLVSTQTRGSFRLEVYQRR